MVTPLKIMIQCNAYKGERVCLFARETLVQLCGDQLESSFLTSLIIFFQSALRMRIRLSYSINGAQIQEQADVNNFPTDTW